MTPISSWSLTQRICSTMSPASTILALGAPDLHLRQSRGRALLDADRAASLSAGVDALEDPAHPVHRTGIVEVRLRTSLTHHSFTWSDSRSGTNSTGSPDAGISTASGRSVGR